MKENLKVTALRPEMRDPFWIEVVGEIVIARLRGEPTEEILRECQAQVIFLVRDSGRGKVLYDALEMQAPSVQTSRFQLQLDSGLGEVRLRRAIVVPNSKLAFLARLAFGEGDYRVFYNDFISAIKWLTQNESS